MELRCLAHMQPIYEVNESAGSEAKVLAEVGYLFPVPSS